MELALESIMSISQEGTVKDYCYTFQILFDQFDINITLEELMKDNELFRNGKIQETIDGSDEMNGLGSIFVDESLENEKDEEVTDSENEIEIDDACNQESVVWKELEGEETSKDIRFVIRSSSIRLDWASMWDSWV
ncbi:hypothetical protein HanRHA438_Chr09g0387561 [Helianthus annuus]|nr:hypothetical protein HanRHA438_Chr09g0387561 [Helianthus annuus]